MPLWKALPGPQTVGYKSEADILGYGGQAGGGKSHLLLGLAITAHLRSIIFRREAKQGRAIVDDARQILGTLGRFNESLGIWRDLPGDRQIEFAGVKDAADVYNWRGQPHDLICVDEADAFLEDQVRFLMGWNRTTVANQRCRTVLCFNPPASAEGRWIIPFFGPWLDKRHHHPAVPGELRWYATVRGGKEVEREDGQPFECDGEIIQPRSRTFIPASVRDNPYLMATNYIATLQALPEPLRSQLLYGDMGAGVADDPWQVIPTAWVQAAMDRWEPGPPEGYTMSALGVDVARGGDDKFVIAARYAWWFAPLVKIPGSQTPDGPTSAARVIAVHDGHADINIDVLPDSCYDCLKGTLGSSIVHGINNAARCDAHDKSRRLTFVNTRAASYWSLREALDPAGDEKLALPPDAELLADLTAPRYKVLASGVQIEKKEDIKKRIHRSTDCADAVVLAHWQRPKKKICVWTGPTTNRLDMPLDMW